MKRSENGNQSFDMCTQSFYLTHRFKYFDFFEFIFIFFLINFPTPLEHHPNCFSLSPFSFLFFPFTFLLSSSPLFHFFIHFTYSNRHVCKTGGKTSIFIFQLCLSRSSCSLSSCLYRFCFLVRHLQGQKG